MKYWLLKYFNNLYVFYNYNNKGITYIYNVLESSFKIIESETRLTDIYKVNETIYFQKLNEGIYKIENGEYLVDSTGQKIIKNYERYLPDVSDIQTWIAIVFILIGITILLSIDYYSKKSDQDA